MMNKIIAVLVMASVSFSVLAQGNTVKVHSDPKGFVLQIDGKNTIVNGMNWDYFPVGHNYAFNLWEQPEELIQKALDNEMSLLQKMGVNAIRVYTGIPKKWIEYIHIRFGIYTMLNHPFGRYGVAIEGNWVANTEYADPKVRTALLQEVQQLTQEYKDTKGLLLFLLGNENNFGLFWEGAETENVPVADQKSTQRAQALYRLFNEAATAMKKIDTHHPVAICNGDLMFLDLIVKECPNIDVLGINVYRGLSFGDLFERVQKEYGKPVLLTEFGADAFNVKTQKEDQEAQAAILKGNWQEIYENASGLGKGQNCIGGFTFQFSDGWWKTGQTYNLDVHDTTASWSNGGYTADYEKGKNNMNEEWFGICAKKPAPPAEVYELQPRLAYFLLQKIHQVNPLSKGMTSKKLHKKIAGITNKTKKN